MTQTRGHAISRALPRESCLKKKKRKKKVKKIRQRREKTRTSKSEGQRSDNEYGERNWKENVLRIESNDNKCVWKIQKDWKRQRKLIVSNVANVKFFLQMKELRYFFCLFFFSRWILKFHFALLRIQPNNVINPDLSNDKITNRRSLDERYSLRILYNSISHEI